MIHGLPELKENEENNRDKRERHDRQILRELCEELGLHCFDSDMMDVRRVGKEPEQVRDESGEITTSTDQ